MRRRLVNLFKPTPPPPPEPEPEPELDVTTNLSEEQRLLRNWLGVVVAEQRKTVKLLDRVREELDRIRGHLVFYTVLMVLGVVGTAVAVGSSVPAASPQAEAKRTSITAKARAFMAHPPDSLVKSAIPQLYARPQRDFRSCVHQRGSRPIAVDCSSTSVRGRRNFTHTGTTVANVSQAARRIQR